MSVKLKFLDFKNVDNAKIEEKIILLQRFNLVWQNVKKMLSSFTFFIPTHA